MATISVRPKLGPYGSGPEYVGVDITVGFTLQEREEPWETINSLLNREFIITVIEGKKPEVVVAPTYK